MLDEIQIINATGTTLKESTRFQELKFSVEDQEADLELRDLSQFCKTAIPVNIRHSDYACIGSESC